MTMSTLHTITTHKKYRELLAEWAVENKDDSEDKNASPTPDPNALVLVAFRTRPPIDGEVEIFDAPLDDEETDDEDQVDHAGAHSPRAKKQPPPALRPVLKIAAQRPPEAFMCGVSARPCCMVVHVPNMTWKGAGLLHKSYDADVCFGPDASNEEVYKKTVKAPGIVNLAMQGGVACVLAYGQTSAGKTYSMMGLELAIAQDLFPLSAGDTGGAAFDIYVTFLELLGNKARDLMRADEAGKNIEIREAETGGVHPALLSTRVDSAQELEDIIVRCLGHRRTAQTSRNAKSSRSHAILTILLKNKSPGGADGEIILVDLAGSERHADSKKHSAARLQETRDNNKSLLALKDCVRARASGAALVPFRTSKLTLLLKPIFDRKTSRPTRTVVIAHVSPHIQDAEHSANTLGYVAAFKAVR
ncbi:P-loop containing nucleoside triphosphate hydrolase protein [Mycena maculata]|uniref:Kinesin-like protein n=1 Tax=Mycena maculata TaxID=230809 RepID=A0AAD7NID0_9AGAR|nr:P-loop containing nucleoside triphosphate hydrolase protein [Mycena maculata]